MVCAKSVRAHDIDNTCNARAKSEKSGAGGHSLRYKIIFVCSFTGLGQKVHRADTGALKYTQPKPLQPVSGAP